MSISAAQHDALMDVADQTGLTYVPGEANAASPKSWGGAGPSKRQPKLAGEFRGRQITLEPIVNFVKDEVAKTLFGSQAATFSQSFTHVTLRVRNRAGLFLKIRPDSPPGKQIVLGDRAGPAAGGDPFLRNQFTSRAIGLIARTYPPASGLSDLPYIRLEGSELVCIQDGYPNDAGFLYSLVNALCDVAELAEDLGSRDA